MVKAPFFMMPRSHLERSCSWPVAREMLVRLAVMEVVHIGCSAKSSPGTKANEKRWREK